MHNKNSAELKSDKIRNNDERRDSEPSELLIGSVTFVVFLVFMTVWMYFSD